MADRITILRDGKRVGVVFAGGGLTPRYRSADDKGCCHDGPRLGHRDLRGSQVGLRQPQQTDLNPRTFVRTEIYGEQILLLRPAGSLASPAFKARVTAIFFGGRRGRRRRQYGEIILDGHQLPLGSVRHAVQEGISLFRRTVAAPRLLLLSQCAPIFVSAIGFAARCAALGFDGRGKSARMAQYYIDRLSVRPPYAETRIGALSGGNQQKSHCPRA